MIHNILDGIRTKGLVESNGDEVKVVARHLGNKPLGARQGPDTDRPAVELGVTHDGAVEVHQSGTKGVDALVDLTVCLPAVVAIGLCLWVVRAIA